MNIGTPEIVLLAVLAIILYGKRLPEIMRALGKGYQEFHKSFNTVKKDFQEEMQDISSNIKETNRYYSGPSRQRTGLPAEASAQAGLEQISRLRRVGSEALGSPLVTGSPQATGGEITKEEKSSTSIGNNQNKELAG